MSDESLQQLTQDVADLKNLFMRRLMDDKATKQLIQGVNASLERRDAIDQFKVFAPMVKELLLAVDRLKDNDSTPDLNRSVADELLTVLSRYGLEQIETTGKVDPRIHNIVGIAPLTDGVEPDTIVQVVRSGYLLSGSVLRPAEVVVARRN